MTPAEMEIEERQMIDMPTNSTSYSPLKTLEGIKVGDVVKHSYTFRNYTVVSLDPIVAVEEIEVENPKEWLIRE